jgi:hypothetical protein
MDENDDVVYDVKDDDFWKNVGGDDLMVVLILFKSAVNPNF